MKYRIVKENRPTLKNYGRYKAVAVHYQTVSPEQLRREIQANCSAKASDVTLVLTELAETIRRHLQDGDRVRIEELGLLKLEIEADRVDHPEDFDMGQHFRSFRLHVLPESLHGHPQLYEGITLERVRQLDRR